MEKTTEEVKEVTRNADAFCFDVDSTIIAEDCSAQLAKFCGKGEEISISIAKTMEGNMTLQECLATGLNILRPSFQQLKHFIEQHTPRLSPNIENLIQRLHSRGIPVYLISGGFQSIILPIATKLNIPHENVFANRLKFYYSGEYAGFDEHAPTSRSGGKAVVVQALKEKYGYKNLVLVGDGATDLEACPPAGAFIGYGGNIVRQSVKEKSSWFITDFKEILNVIQ